jgi:hypothetical protein
MAVGFLNPIAETGFQIPVSSSYQLKARQLCTTLCIDYQIIAAGPIN